MTEPEITTPVLKVVELIRNEEGEVKAHPRGSTLDWPLFVPASYVANAVEKWKLFESTMNVPGDIAEFGVYKGANLIFLAHLLKTYDSLSKKRITGFDTFEGFLGFTEEDGDIAEIFDKKTYSQAAKFVAAAIRSHEYENLIQLVKGDICDTLERYLDANKHKSFSFIYCDVDLYAPTHEILFQTHERLSTGGIFVFDQWNHPDWPGETIAVREFLEAFPNQYKMEHVPNTMWPTMALRKIA